MSKSYLVIERGLTGERFFHLQSRLTIGRAPESDIHLPHLSVSRHHALAYVEDEKAVLEDLSSRNGTYVNEERVKKAVLSNGDMVRIGNVTVIFLEEREHSIPNTMKETLESTHWSDQDTDMRDTLLPRSKRLRESISNLLLFSCLEREDLDQVCNAAKLAIYNPGKAIVRHGDWGDFLYIILDGKVRIFSYDHQGKDINLHLLGANSFFGEGPFLTGSLHTNTVEAVEETLLCQLSYEVMRELAERYPIVKGLLEQSHRELLDYAERRRRSQGFERRKDRRYEMTLAVSFSVSPGPNISDKFQKKIFKGATTNISLSGARLRVKDISIQLLPIGWDVRLEIFLPHSQESIRCIGIVKNIMEEGENDDTTHIGIEFLDVSSASQRLLENFLYTSSTAEG